MTRTRVHTTDHMIHWAWEHSAELDVCDSGTMESASQVRTKRPDKRSIGELSVNDRIKHENVMRGSQKRRKRVALPTEDKENVRISYL